jgi:hypothetical protein
LKSILPVRTEQNSWRSAGRDIGRGKEEEQGQLGLYRAESPAREFSKMRSSSGSNLATSGAGINHADSPSRNISNDKTRGHIDDDDSSIYSSSSNSHSCIKGKIEGTAVDSNNQSQNKNRNQNRKDKAVRNIIENSSDSYSSNAKSKRSNQNNILPTRNVPKNIPVEEAENVPARLYFPNIETPTQRSPSNSPKKEREKKNRITVENNVENKRGEMLVLVYLTSIYLFIV